MSVNATKKKPFPCDADERLKTWKTNSGQDARPAGIDGYAPICYDKKKAAKVVFV